MTSVHARSSSAPLPAPTPLPLRLRAAAACLTRAVSVTQGQGQGQGQAAAEDTEQGTDTPPRISAPFGGDDRGQRGGAEQRSGQAAAAAAAADEEEEAVGRYVDSASVSVSASPSVLSVPLTSPEATDSLPGPRFSPTSDLPSLRTHAHAHAHAHAQAQAQALPSSSSSSPLTSFSGDAPLTFSPQALLPGGRSGRQTVHVAGGHSLGRGTSSASGGHSLESISIGHTSDVVHQVVVESHSEGTSQSNPSLTQTQSQQQQPQHQSTPLHGPPTPASWHASRAAPTPPKDGDTDSASNISSMELWNGGTSGLPSHVDTRITRPLTLHVAVSDTDSEVSRRGSALTAATPSDVTATPLSRYTQRKRQQRSRHDGVWAQPVHVSEAARRQAVSERRLSAPPEDVASDSDTAAADADHVAEHETESTPLAAAYRISIGTGSTAFTSPSLESGTGAVASDPSSAGCASLSPHPATATASATAPSAPKRWWRKRRVVLPLLCVLSVVLALLLAMWLLWPSAPSITTESVRVSDLRWRPAADGSGALTANMTIAVNVHLRNSNKFGSHFSETPVDTFVSMPGGDRQKVTTLTLPAGYIGAQSELSLMMSAPIINTRLAKVSDLITLLQRMSVSSDSRTKGHVKFIGLSIPYTVRTQCTATCKVDLLTFAVDILEQQCSSHT